MTQDSKVSPKEFQRATIAAATVRLMDPSGARRFLVADEPGLGKTVVARGVIEALQHGSSGKRLVVFYVCSSQAIASQNVDQLVSGLSEVERKQAKVSVDRPGLLPIAPELKHPHLAVYSMTPGTAYSSSRKGSSGGVAKERALACAALEVHFERRQGVLREVLRRKVDKDRFNKLVAALARQLRGGIENRDGRTRRFVDEFWRVLKDALKQGLSVQVDYKFVRNAAHTNAKEFTAICRNSLACAALSSIQPDLIVFDEFQKFRDVMRKPDEQEPMDRAQTKILSLLTGAAENTRLLLLSATPYEAMRLQKRKPGQEVECDFFEVLDFLFGNLPHAKAFGRGVRKLFATNEQHLKDGKPLCEQAVKSRALLTEVLRMVMCRTERPRGTQSTNAVHALTVELPLLSHDLKIFRSFVDYVGEDEVHWAVPLWSSVPLPVQTLGSRYQCWNNAAEFANASELSASHIVSWKAPAHWPSPKLRALEQVLPARQLAMPWVSPSRPWWALQDGWDCNRSADRQGADGKLLVFSRFAAVPGAISGLTSYELECHLRKGGGRGQGYGDWVRPKFAKPARSPTVFTLFHVSQKLAELDPLEAGLPAKSEEALRLMERSLRRCLASNGIKVLKSRKKRPLPLHVLMIALAKSFGYWDQERQAWIHAMASDEESAGEVEDVLHRWERMAPHPLAALDATTELRALVQLSLDSPAISFTRALRRHWPQALQEQNHEQPSGRLAVQQFVLVSLRKYLDRPWFAAALQDKRSKDFGQALRRSVVAGNFEAVMDEHLWLLAHTKDEPWGARLKELARSLALSGGRTVIHERGKGSDTARLRCHVALPLHQAKVSDTENPEDGPRPDQVRHAFNTPFWPMVLTTTSVGQEGLDFHLWCRSIAHWDLARTPVELEQREGRVARYSSLSIRRALAADPRFSNFNPAVSVWEEIARQARNRADDASQMSPWWKTEGAATQQFYLCAQGSREAHQRRRLERARALYRMVFGASDPAPLLEELEANEAITEEMAREASLCLSAWELRELEVQSVRQLRQRLKKEGLWV